MFQNTYYGIDSLRNDFLFVFVVSFKTPATLLFRKQNTEKQHIIYNSFLLIIAVADTLPIDDGDHSTLPIAIHIMPSCVFATAEQIGILNNSLPLPMYDFRRRAFLPKCRFHVVVFVIQIGTAFMTHD